MNKYFLTIVLALFTVEHIGAQALATSKWTDNWYAGISGGACSKTTHNSVLGNLNPHAGLRVGRYWTPVTGWAIEGTTFFNDRQFNRSSTFIKALNVNLLGTINLSNWLAGYPGRPRTFEAVCIAGIGWNRVFGIEDVNKNDFVSKLGCDLTFNLGASRAWQVYLEPAINYDMDRYFDSSMKYHIKTSALQLSLGLNYKFGNSNGTHNFRSGLLRNQHEVDKMNQQINELRSEAEAKDKRIAQGLRRIAELEEELEAIKNMRPQVVTKSKE